MNRTILILLSFVSYDEKRKFRVYSFFLNFYRHAFDVPLTYVSYNMYLTVETIVMYDKKKQLLKSGYDVTGSV